MFVALRDIRFARGRFALMGSVIALITLLIVLLSGLTAGLADRSTSAVEGLAADRIAFGASGDGEVEASYADSTVTAGQVEAWSAAEGVAWAEPLGITPTRVETPAEDSAAVALFGAPAGGHLAPEGLADGLVVGTGLAEELGVSAGDTLTVAGTALTVDALADTGDHSHMPAVWADIAVWREIDPRVRHARGEDAPVANAVAVGLAPGADGAASAGAADAAARTLSETRSGSRTAIGSFSSENGSLLTMQAFLYGISALVVGAFLTVWTVQRSGDIAILKALGGSTRYLLRDALAQALAVLLAGTAAGGAAGAVLGALAAGALPFSLTAATTLGPVAALVVLGMLGAGLAVRRITSVDPLTALGGVR